MTGAGNSLVMLSLPSFQSAWWSFLKDLLGDADFVLVFPLGLAGFVTVALFCVEWMLYGFDRNHRSL
jgi:hypothetical protein